MEIFIQFAYFFDGILNESIALCHRCQLDGKSHHFVAQFDKPIDFYTNKQNVLIILNENKKNSNFVISL